MLDNHSYVNWHYIIKIKVTFIRLKIWQKTNCRWNIFWDSSEIVCYAPTRHAVLPVVMSTESSCKREKRRDTTFGQFFIHLFRYNFPVEIDHFNNVSFIFLHVQNFIYIFLSKDARSQWKNVIDPRGLTKLEKYIERCIHINVIFIKKKPNKHVRVKERQRKY